MTKNWDELLTLTLYGVVVVLTALGGIFGPPIVLLPAAALAVLWIVIFSGHWRERKTR